MSKVFPLVALVVSLSCAVMDGSSTSHGIRETDDALLLMNLDRQFSTETAEKGVEGWVRYFADNGSMVSGTSAPTIGREAIRRLMTPVFSDSSFSLRWIPEKGGILIPGRLGFTVGRYEQRSRNEAGKHLRQLGIYSTIWMKQPDASWRILLDTGTADSSPSLLD